MVFHEHVRGHPRACSVVIRSTLLPDGIRRGGVVQMSEPAGNVLTAEPDSGANRDVVSGPAARKPTMALSEKLDLSFAVWLSRQLRRQRISQRELARRGGLDHSTISRILVGARAPSWSTMQRIAQVVGFPPPNVLLGAFRTRPPGEEPPPRSQGSDER